LIKYFKFFFVYFAYIRAFSYFSVIKPTRESLVFEKALFSFICGNYFFRTAFLRILGFISENKSEKAAVRNIFVRKPQNVAVPYPVPTAVFTGHKEFS
jgi:hypothetical protein